MWVKEFLKSPLNFNLKVYKTIREIVKVQMILEKRFEPRCVLCVLTFSVFFGFESKYTMEFDKFFNKLFLHKNLHILSIFLRKKSKKISRLRIRFFFIGKILRKMFW